MTTQLTESLDFSLAAPSKGNKWKVKVIEAGWGSSGYYGPDMLAHYGPNVFTKGTKVFMNHPSVSEANDRPERNVEKLAGKLVSDAYFTENGLVAEIEFYSHYAPIIKEMAGDVGLSIHAMGSAVMGEAEGRQGPIIESLVADPLTSVDVVTVAGAGGKFLSLLESYTRNDAETEQVAESLSEGNGMSITKEEFEAAIADLKTAFVEALSPVIESVSVLAEAAKPAEAEEGVEGEAVEAEPEIDPVDLAAKLHESGLPKVALARVVETLKAEANTKTADEIIADEKAYVTSVSESAAVATSTAATFGKIEEASTTNTPANELDAIVGRIAGK
jgi:hypothetical protein